eukprot:2914291-Pyramimonas_sp.AAC.1
MPGDPGCVLGDPGAVRHDLSTHMISTATVEVPGYPGCVPLKDPDTLGFVPLTMISRPSTSAPSNSSAASTAP